MQAMRIGRQVSFLTYLAPSQKAALDRLARTTRQPRARIIRAAIAAYLRTVEGRVGHGS